MFLPLPIIITIVAVMLAVPVLILGIRHAAPGIWARHEEIKNFIEAFAFLAAGAWAISTFVYSEKIKPQNEPPEVAVQATLEEVGRNQSAVAVKATVSARNIGKTKVSVIAAYYNVEGFKIERLSKSDDGAYHRYAAGELDKLAKPESPGDVTLSRYTKHHGSQGAVVHSSNLMQNWTMDPGDEYSRNTVFYVASADYNHLKINFKIYVARNSNYENKIHRHWQLADDKDEIAAEFFVKDGGKPCDETSPEKNCAPFNPRKNADHKKIIEEYGMTHYDALSELSLWKK